ncbi:MAG: AAA family ATPase, partial [Actinobacteria bacterium]|nr:AAA family ATPase [Actinomycetota bacterium]
MIQSIRLQNYRSYIDDSFEVDGAVNIIVGPNASGKTNLIESILVSAQGKSYRNSDEDLIHHQSDWGRVDIQLNDEKRTLK